MGCCDDNNTLGVPKGNDGEQGEPGTSGTNGAPGESVAYTLTTIDPGVDCPNGGYQIELGPDANGDGVPDTIQDTLIICNGEDGTSGSDYEFPFKPILYVYDDPDDLTKFDATGLGEGIYDGWKICNGQNSTPDLRGRVIVSQTNLDNTNYAYSNAVKNDTDYDTCGNTGGNKTEILAKNHIPKHQHTVNTSTSDAGQIAISSGAHTHSYTNWPNQADIGNGGSSATNNGTATAQTTGGTGAHTHTISGNTGDGTTDKLKSPADGHPNVQPYFVLLPIIKI